MKSSLQLFDFVVSLITQLVELIHFSVENHASSLSVFDRNKEYYCFSKWLVVFTDEWFSTREFRWISIRGLRETISKFFETLFSRRTTRHDEVCLKRKLNEWWCLTIEEERRIEWCLIFNKEDEIDWLIWFLSNSRRFFIVDSLNWVEQLIFTRLFHENELILLIEWTLRT